MLVLEYVRKENEDTAVYISKTSRKRRRRSRLTGVESEDEGDIRDHSEINNSKHGVKRMVITESSSSSSEQLERTDDFDGKEDDVKLLRRSSISKDSSTRDRWRVRRHCCF